MVVVAGNWGAPVKDMIDIIFDRGRVVLVLVLVLVIISEETKERGFVI